LFAATPYIVAAPLRRGPLFNLPKGCPTCEGEGYSVSVELLFMSSASPCLDSLHRRALQPANAGSYLRHGHNIAQVPLGDGGFSL
jgi:hypothetical protein